MYEYLCFYCVSNKIHLSVFGKITKIDINASLGHLLIAYILIGFAFNIQVEMGITYIYMKIDELVFSIIASACQLFIRHSIDLFQKCENI
jgi:hypothetical protein